MNGIIYKIERLAVYDGPGIRTVIFLKGCPLSCIWCASPESQKRTPETGFWQDKCTGCGSCLDVCPAAAVTKDLKSNIIYDHKKCQNCGQCTPCLSGARKTIGKKFSVGDVVRELEKDSVFYHRSTGGITLSGGDPVFQPIFSAGILKKAVEMGFHTAMETCAHAEWNLFKGMLEHLDLIYVDIKHMNRHEHKKLTGKTNGVILENIQQMDTHFPNLEKIVRVPIIPGKNDSKENIDQTAKFARGLKTLKRVELLPYHRYGVATYPVVGKKYQLTQMDSPNRIDVEALMKRMTNQGIRVQIGG